MPALSEPNLTLVEPPEGDPSDPVALLPHANLAARYCTHRGVTLEGFGEALLARALYPAARWLRPLLELLPNYFAPDRAFLAMVGRATSVREVELAVVDFADHRGPYRFLRKRLRLRVSASTVWMIAERFLKEETTPSAGVVAGQSPRLHSASPFQLRENAWRSGMEAVSASNAAAVRATRASEDAEIARLRGEVARLSAQCELMKRAVNLFCETKSAPPSYT